LILRSRLAHHPSSGTAAQDPREAQARSQVNGALKYEAPRAHARAASPGDSSRRLGMTEVLRRGLIETRSRCPDVCMATAERPAWTADWRPHGDCPEHQHEASRLFASGQARNGGIDRFCTRRLCAPSRC
jgi:hypothetical protein